jgi:GH15 family glucan-1,4-alpha-glucosidase
MAEPSVESRRIEGPIEGRRIEDYAMIGDGHTAALVATDGAIEWLCLPRFDSGACFASMLGSDENGHWTIAPQEQVLRVERRYRPGTLVLETDMVTDSGSVRIIDVMPHRHANPTVIRIVEGLTGEVPMHTVLRLRLDYGRAVPWVRRTPDGIRAVAGPDAIVVHTPVPLHGENMHTVGTFGVAAGDMIPFTLTWYHAGDEEPAACDAVDQLARAETEWREWSDRTVTVGRWGESVLQSLVTLKALIYEPSGGIIAAPTTSLPEQLGGSRNWDYRYSWLRDASLTLQAFTANGCLSEAMAWRDWLLRAIAGDPAQLQIMYGVDGERRLPELELDWLPGYHGSRPVRIGNGAAEQFQLDVYGEVMDALHQARTMGMAPDDDAWALQRKLVEFVEQHWREPDEGIWEIRGPRRHFTHSKVMAWVAFDRAASGVELHGLSGDAARFRALAHDVHRDVCSAGFDDRLGTFVQHYGSTELDASLLLLPIVGFLSPDDPRIVATVDAIARDLTQDGLVKRYRTDGVDTDGLDGGEGTFLLCTFWLVQALAMRGERERATALFERVLTLRNDVGLLSEEYDVVAQRMLGNFPQAFSHIGLVNAARSLDASLV